MNPQTRKIAIVAGVLLLALLVGSRFFPRPQPKPAPQSTAHPFNPYEQNVTLPAGFNPASLTAMGMNQIAMMKLVGQGIPIGIANYLTQAKAQVLGQTNTSAHFILTFGNDLTSDETITLTPNQLYTPTPVELTESGQRHVYAVKFSVQNESDTKARIHLQYFVPYTAVPADLRRSCNRRPHNGSNLCPQRRHKKAAAQAWE